MSKILLEIAWYYSGGAPGGANLNMRLLTKYWFINTNILNFFLKNEFSNRFYLNIIFLDFPQFQIIQKFEQSHFKQLKRSSSSFRLINVPLSTNETKIVLISISQRAQQISLNCVCIVNYFFMISPEGVP